MLITIIVVLILFTMYLITYFKYQRIIQRKKQYLKNRLNKTLQSNVKGRF
jgi:hypothetical protein